MKRVCQLCGDRGDRICRKCKELIRRMLPEMPDDVLRKHKQKPEFPLTSNGVRK